MISLKKYLDSTSAAPVSPPAAERRNAPAREKAKGSMLALAIGAYRSALREMGACSVDACPGLGPALKQSLAGLEDQLSVGSTAETLEDSRTGVEALLQDWGRGTAAHYRQKTAEVKDLLLTMARSAESVGERDHRCAGQIGEVTSRLEAIASLEDLTEIRASIEQSAVALKSSVDRMAAEGKQAIAMLRAQVSSYQVKLEEAEELASRDALTGLHNRFWMENHIVQCMRSGGPLCLAIVDIDEFKRVNDEHGHLAGDELLRQFAAELRSAGRATDETGRWGGDEFILVLHCGLAEAEAQIERLPVWVCGSYTLAAGGAPVKLKVDASIGVAEHLGGKGIAEDSMPEDMMMDLLARADTSMYMRKPDRRGAAAPAR